MNYRHVYHAGNFADVVKHFVLTLLLAKLCQKDTPFSVIDTHAGIGLYDLTGEEAQKTLEYEAGINRLLKLQDVDPVFQPYLDVVRSMNSTEAITHYPGSPAIAWHFMRPQDKLFLSELHLVDCEKLKKNFNRNAQVKVFCQDFQITLKALLPPLHRRGLVLIDPPFEKTDEFDRVIEGLQYGFQRFPYGIFVLWYPIKDMKVIQKFHERIKNLNLAKTLAVDFLIHKADIPNRLNGSGLIIFNPPWQLDKTLEYALPKLLRYLYYDKQGRVKLQWLC